MLEDDPVGRLKVFVYQLPSKYNKKILQKDSRCLTHMFAAEIFMHRFLLSSPVRTLNPEEADWFYTPVYTTCDLTPNGLPLPFKSPRMMRSAIQLIASNWPYWNRSEGADHFFVVPHDFGACFHYQVRNWPSDIDFLVLQPTCEIRNSSSRSSSLKPQRIIPLSNENFLRNHDC